MEKWRKDHLKAASALKVLLDSAEVKLNAPVQVSFLNVRGFLQDVEVSGTNHCNIRKCKYSTIYTYYQGQLPSTTYP